MVLPDPSSANPKLTVVSMKDGLFEQGQIEMRDHRASLDKQC